MITIRYECTPQELRIGQILAGLAKRRRRRISPTTGWVLFGGGCAAVYLLFSRLFGDWSNPVTPHSVLSTWGFYLAFTGGLFVWRALRLFDHHNRIRNQAGEQLLTLTFSSEGLLRQYEDFSHFASWSHFTGFIENPAVFVLRRTNSSGITIPKRLLSASELIEIRELLVAKLAVAVPTLTHGFEVQTT